MAELLADPFLARALTAGLLASLLCGILGTFLVLRRLAFLVGGLSHAAFGGIGLCHFLGLPPQVGALATVFVAGAVLGPLPREEARAQDALIGVLWAAGMAVGVLFLHFAPGYAPDLSAYLFGNLLLVTRTDLLLLVAFDLLTLLLVTFFYKELVAFSFDATFAAVQGVPVRLISTSLLLLLGASVVVLLPIVGLLLALALLTIPPLIALGQLRRLKPVLLASVALAALITVGGLAIAYQLDAPSGPSIILLGVGLLGLQRGWRWIGRST